MSLALDGISKRFGTVQANDGVVLAVDAGELHGLLGENGAGKSTLMKILSGFLRADSGTIVLDGNQLDLRSPRDAIDAGIGMLHQDPLVFLPMTVLENFLLGTGRAIERDEAERLLAELAGRYGFSFDPDARVRTLTVGERQQLEIVRLLWLGARVLILDEPTTGISESQRLLLFDVLRTLAGEGLTVIVVSHKLEEVEALCHRVTVMRKGKVVGGATLPTDRSGLIEMMFGQVTVGVPHGAAALGAPALTVTGFGRHRDENLTVASGEVLGLAGLEGSGQRRFLRACGGLDRTGQTISVSGQDLTGRPYRAYLDAGVHLMPAGRLEEGLVPGLTIAEHLELVGGNQSLVVDWDSAERLAAERISEFSIKGAATTLADALSGGNQQRLLMAMMPDDLMVLLMEHPTRGLDIESAEWIWRRLLERRERGTAIVFASSDLDELLRYSDRIAVFFGGEVIAVVPASTTSPHELGSLIGGVLP